MLEFTSSYIYVVVWFQLNILTICSSMRGTCYLIRKTAVVSILFLIIGDECDHKKKIEAHTWITFQKYCHRASHY